MGKIEIHILGKMWFPLKVTKEDVQKIFSN
jgi:hypothetical protein